MAGTWILFFIHFLLNNGVKSQDLRINSMLRGPMDYSLVHLGSLMWRLPDKTLGKITMYKLQLEL